MRGWIDGRWVAHGAKVVTSQASREGDDSLGRKPYP